MQKKQGNTMRLLERIGFVAMFAGLLFGGFFSNVTPVYATNTDPSAPTCAFVSDEDTVVVSFNDRLRSDKSESHARGDVVNTTLTAGVYEVSLMAWDGYTNRVSVTQPHEQFYVVLSNDGSLVASSNATNDLIDEVVEDSFVGVVDAELELVSDVNEVQAVHAEYSDRSNANSVEAICAAFRVVEQEEPEPTGSIRVCKAILDENGDIVDGSENNGSFSIKGLDVLDAVSVLPTSAIATPLSYNTDLFADVEGNDAKCVTYDDLTLGSYYYDEEEIESGDYWGTPLYDDGNTAPVATVLDVDNVYSGELFNNDASDDDARNTDADGHIILSENRPDRTLVIVNQYDLPEPDTTFTIVGTKVMCDSEADLPNWSGDSVSITDTTATDYVAQNDNCRLEKDWYFQWATVGTANPGDNLGEVDVDWTTFGPTDDQGVTTVSVDTDSLNDASRVWVREVFQDGHVEFTHGTTQSDVSAEMYCHTDVLNYDNYDYISNPATGETYYCVAFNAPETPDNPDNSCPFVDKDGRIIIDFEDGIKIKDSGTTVLGPESVSIEAGTYKVSLASFDGYENRIDANQPSEIWKLKLLDDNTTVAVSNATTDLADDVNYAARTDVVNTELVIGSDVTKAKAIHGLSSNGPTANSLEPVCAALDLIEEEPKTQCSDGKDNDDDYLVDQDDPGCWIDPTDPGTYDAQDDNEYYVAPDPKQCSDTKDNDGDGLTDAADPGCWTNPEDPQSYDPNDDDETHIPPYANYCGDGVVNQEWEMCDGTDGLSEGESCTAQCQLDNQCVAKAFARVNTDSFENHTNGDASSDVFLGSALNKIPGGTWFIVYDNGLYITDASLDEDVPGIAVQRKEGEVRTLLHGSHPHDGSKETVEGNVEFFNVDVATVENDPSGNNTLENGFNGVMDNVPGEDEVWIQNGNSTQSFFYLTVTTADDAFYTTYENEPSCQLPNQKPTITILGDNTLEIDLNGTYSDPGATASDPEDGDITDDIDVGGDAVDPSNVGTYFVTYDVVDSEGLAADTATRTVNVVDNSNPTQCNDGLNNDNDGENLIDETDPGCWTDPEDPNTYDPNLDDENQKPVITLRGSSAVEVALGGTYTEEGADVNDPEEGDIDDKLVIGGDVVDTSATGTFTITYNATDTQNVAADEVTRTVTVVDDSTPETQCNDGVTNDNDDLVDADDPGCHTDGDPDNPDSYDKTDDSENETPVITLNGNSTVQVTVGAGYNDAGATANDPEDGNITDDIQTNNPVNPNAVGSYVVTYNVTDSDGAAAVQVTRTVNVNPATTGGGGGGGGGHIPSGLRISNENIQIISEGTALITWKTNKPANSRVVYDDDSHTISIETKNFGTGSENLNYEFTTTASNALVTDHSVVVTNVNLEDLFYFRPISVATSRAVGIELNANLGVVDAQGCSQYLNEFIRFGANNNPNEVQKLQRFLNEFEGNDIDVTGVYNGDTFAAVVAFQNKYADDVLSPWGLENDTGYVYLTTRKKINEIYCDNQLQFPLTPAQQEEVNEFRQLLQNLEATGQPLPDTSNVGVAPQTQTPNLAGTDTEPTVTLTEETEGNEEGTQVAEEDDTTDSLAAALSAVEEGENGGGILNRIQNFLRGIFR